MKTMKCIAMIAGLLTASSAIAGNNDLNLGIYGKSGLPGFTLGVGYGFNEYVTARADFATLGTIKRKITSDDVTFDAAFSNNKVNLLVDIFPFANGFRLTSGLGLLSTKLSAKGYPTNTISQQFKFGESTYSIQVDQNDNINAEVRFPKASPYLGLGYGHHFKQQNGNELGFLFDLGVYIGKPTSTLNISQSLNDKLAAAEKVTDRNSSRTVKQDIDSEKAKIDEVLNKVPVLPVISLGISYRF